MNSLPIGDYALLSDCRSAALVSRDGSIDWLCCPRFDARRYSPASSTLAAAISRRPAGDFQASRRYVDQTMALETTFRNDACVAVLTDAMAMGANDRGHDLGAGSPGVLMRRLRCTGGELDVEVTYAPRPEYGLIYPILEVVAAGLATRGGASLLLLSAPAGLQLDGATATARLHLRTGQTASFALQHGRLEEPPTATWDAGQIDARLRDTVEGWRSWSAIHQHYEGPWRELVHHSGRVLQCTVLSADQRHRRRADHLAAGDHRRRRNWDYRYTWVRDASLTMDALWVAACPDEASEFFSCMADSRRGSARDAATTSRSCSASAASTT